MKDSTVHDSITGNDGVLKRMRGCWVRIDWEINEIMKNIDSDKKSLQFSSEGNWKISNKSW